MNEREIKRFLHIIMKKYLVLKVLVEPALNGGPEKPNIHLQIILILKMTILFQNEN